MIDSESLFLKMLLLDLNSVTKGFDFHLGFVNNPERMNFGKSLCFVSHLCYVDDNAEKLELDSLLLCKRKFPQRFFVKMSASTRTTTLSLNLGRAKKVWIWTKCKEVMTVAVERGWNTFIFSSENRKLSDEWSCNNKCTCSFRCAY